MASPRSEIFERVLTIVSEETEIERKDIFSKKRHTEVVDARHLCVRLLSEHGLYPVCIASKLGLSRRQVNNILTYFDSRMRFSPILRNNYEIIRSKLGSSGEARK